MRRKPTRKRDCTLWGILGVQKEAVLRRKKASSNALTKKLWMTESLAKCLVFCPAGPIGAVLRTRAGFPLYAPRLLRTR